jgi:hypothetical protein
MEEFQVNEENTGISIQTRFFFNPKKKNTNYCVIATCPHPLYGGNFENNVVLGVRDILVENGICFSTFNYRGVGTSTGTFDNAIGEQTDLLNVAKHILQKYISKGIINIFLIGYSFGAVVALAAASKIKNLVGIALISYPFGFMESILPNYELKVPKLFINGKNDNIANYNLLVKEFEKFADEKSMHLVETDHFYNQNERLAGRKILEFIKNYENSFTLN